MRNKSKAAAKLFLIAMFLLFVFSCKEKEYNVTYSVVVPDGKSVKLLVKYYDSAGSKVLHIEDDWQTKVILKQHDVAQILVLTMCEKEDSEKEEKLRRIQMLTDSHMGRNMKSNIRGMIIIGKNETILEQSGEVISLSYIWD